MATSVRDGRRWSERKAKTRALAVAAEDEGDGAGRQHEPERPRPREARQPVPDEAVHEVAGGEGQSDVDEEGRVRRPAVEVHAGHMVENELEAGRVASERVEEGDGAEGEEEAELAGESRPPPMPCQSTSRAGKVPTKR